MQFLRVRVLTCLTLASLWLGAASALAQTTGTISGTVTTNGPAAIEVLVYTATAQLSSAVWVAQGSVNVSSKQYSITGIAPGTYFVRTNGHVFSRWADEWHGGGLVASPGASPRRVTVTAGSTTIIDFSLGDVTATLSGTVTLERLPHKGWVILPHLIVYNEDGVVVRSSELNPTSDGSAGGPLTTDPNPGGTFTWSVNGLPTGRYYVATSGPAQSAPNTGHVSPGPGGLWVDEIYDNVVCLTEDCSVARGTPIEVTGGAFGTGSAAPSSIAMTLDYGAQITGSVPPAFFLGTTTLRIYDARGVRLPNRITGSAFGGYFANGLPSGTYFILLNRDPQGNFPSTLYKDQPCDGCAVTSGTPVTVTLGETKSGIDFTLMPSRAIKGTVRSGGTALAGVTVEVFGPNGARIGSVTTASDGSYTFAALNPGTFYLRTLGTAGYVDEIHGNQQCPSCDPLRGTPVTVTATADTTGIDFDLSTGVEVSGLVQTVGLSSGVTAPVTGIGISLFTPQGALAARGVSDRTGRFAVTLPSGTYYAMSDAERGFVRRLHVDATCPGGICDVTTGAAIVVSAAPVTNVDLVPRQCSAPSIAPVALARAAVGTAYRQTLATSGASSGVLYSVSAGTLPPGLTLTRETGVISGTPATAGNFTFTIAAETSTCTGSRTYTLDVPGCVLTLPATPVSRATGEPFLLPIATNCATWSVASNTAWITIQKAAADSVLLITSPHSGTTPRTGSVTIGSRVLTVYQNGSAPQPPFGVLEIPNNGQVMAGSIAVSGWALDDLAIQRVAIYRDPVAGEGSAQIYIGDATIVEGARPDVEAAYPALPGNRRAGFGYLLLTNMLPNGGNGTFNLHVYADDIDGNRVLLASRTVVGANSTATSPFGAIDTPAQGATVSGAGYVNFGWALTPQPKLIPFDGSTINVVIDGVPIGRVTSYNLFRFDVSGLFPGLKNSGGPVGYRAIDTTALSEGVHTIAWVATDDAGQATGIGSRYFTVQNSAWTPSQTLASRLTPPAFHVSELGRAEVTTAVPPRIDGVDIGRRIASLASFPIDAGGSRVLDLASLEHLELTLPGSDDACAPTYAGYLAAGGELRALPVGASLDRRGTFYWQPGAAFRGEYSLVFVRTGCEGAETRIPVTIRIR